MYGYVGSIINLEILENLIEMGWNYYTFHLIKEKSAFNACIGNAWQRFFIKVKDLSGSWYETYIFIKFILVAYILIQYLNSNKWTSYKM